MTEYEATPARNNVTSLIEWRREPHIVESITLVFGGINYGTVMLHAPYVAGAPFRLYVVPSPGGDTYADGGSRGRLDCLVTDDPALGESLSATGP